MDELIPGFDNYLSQSSPQISLLSFSIGLVLTAISAYIVKLVYVRFGQTLSNRHGLGSLFIPLAMTTMLIITIVKSSLALSLGLVGALSIVRFRTAIKEPEELAYLFLCIAIGLGFGANQTVITILGLLLILAIITLSRKFVNNF